jgi:hypothetical protein
MGFWSFVIGGLLIVVLVMTCFAYPKDMGVAAVDCLKSSYVVAKWGWNVSSKVVMAINNKYFNNSSSTK